MQNRRLGLASDTRRRPLDIVLEIGAAASRADVVVAWALALAIMVGIGLLFAAS
ncbi:MAG TPA: hypothetical protein VEC75_04625 [Stellaceae bacterium]|nr:hypothetical protein [Stellaceae bacterium]